MQVINQLLVPFYKQYPNYRVIYLTLTGSKLYGTDGPNSDCDYKGIFIPTTEDLLLQIAPDHYTSTTGDDKSRNGADDIDLQLWSIHKFLNLLKKGETGALDLLFSMKREDTQLFTTKASSIIRSNIPQLLHKSVHSFIGYCIGQSKKYNIKGERYNELTHFIGKLQGPLSVNYIVNYFDYKYIKIVQAPGPRGNKGDTDITYISVLGKLFDISLPREYILDKLVKMEKQYGNRAKAATDSVDYKALSHAVRVLLEVKELLARRTITFPLEHADYIKSIKSGKESLESVMEVIANGIEEVDQLMLSSSLPDKPNITTYNKLLLELLNDSPRPSNTPTYDPPTPINA